MLLVAVIFPGLYHSIFVDYEIKFESPFELGHKAYLLIGSNILLFAFGIIYLGAIIGYEKAIQVGLLPFIPSEIFKIALAVAIIPTLHNFVKNK